MKYLSNLVLTFLMFFFNSTPQYEIYSAAIIEQFRKETLAPNDARICSLGGSSDKGIKMIHLGVNVPGIRNIAESRKILVNLVERLLYLYNDSVKIREFLLNYPFLASNLQFEISFVNKDNHFFYLQSDIDAKDQITYVTLHNGEVCYDIHTGGRIAPLRTIYSEPYQDALKIVQSEKNQ